MPYRLPYAEGQSFNITQAPGGFITTHYGAYNQYAVDFAMPEGTPVLAAQAGTVIAAGSTVRVMHADGSIGNYLHLQSSFVHAGEGVAASTLLGLSGSSGWSSGPHLHFAVTRLVPAGDGFEEVSEPIRFYVGNPPLAFTPRVGQSVIADYGAHAVAPADASVVVALPLRSGEAILDWPLLLVVSLSLFATAVYYRFARD